MESVSVTLYDKRVFVDEIKDFKNKKVSWITRVSAKCGQKCPYKKEQMEVLLQRAEKSVMTKPECSAL
jgi:hypothetical protein